MSNKKSSGAFRWLAVGLLALSVVPMGVVWRQEMFQKETPPSLSDLQDQNWTDVSQLEVQLKPGSDDATLAELSRKIGAAITWNSDVSRTETEIADVALPAGTDSGRTLDLLRADPNVVVADRMHFLREPEDEANQISRAARDLITGKDETESGRWKPNDPRFNEQWNFQMVKAEEAWEVSKGKGVVVAVIDTGVAFANNRKGKQARDFSGTSFVPGYDFVNHDAMPNDDQGHGTHVAGTIAETTNNAEGVAGLAFEAKIMPLKVLSSTGSGRTTDIAEAIRWAADHGANVINMSLGGPLPDNLMASACEYAKNKGVTIICAAGNSGREGVGYPAAYKDCVAISSVGPSGNLSFFSSWGKQVALAAPGGDKQAGGDAGGILQNTVLKGDNGNVEDDYYAFQGTSMASPHAAAVAALIVSQGVQKPDDVKAILQKSAVKKGDAKHYGAGVLNAAAAVKLAAATQGDRWARFLLVAGLFFGAWRVGKSQRAKNPLATAPYWGTAAFSFGLLFPDWLTGLIGQTSLFNLIGHSILIPGALMMLGGNGKRDRRLIGLMAMGLSLHVGWEFLRNTAPFGSEIGFWQLLPWVGANLLIGGGMALNALGSKE